jgi:hypothetical protein
MPYNHLQTTMPYNHFHSILLSFRFISFAQSCSGNFFFMPDLLFWQCRCYPGCRSTKGRLLQPNPCFSWQMLLFLARIVPYTVALPSRPIACLLLHLTTPAWCRLLVPVLQNAVSPHVQSHTSGHKWPKATSVLPTDCPAPKQKLKRVYWHLSNRVAAEHGRMDDSGRTDVWILNDVVSCTAIT